MGNGGYSMLLAFVLPLCPPSIGQAGEPPAAETQPPFRWELRRHSGNPVLRARPGTWEAEWFTVESVLRVDGQYYMYYTGAREGDNKTSALGLAVSDDGIHWRRHKTNPIWGYKNWDNFLRDVRVHRFGPDDYWLYYSDGDRHLDLARSPDGIHWRNYGQNPILVPSQLWEHHIMQQRVLRLHGLWRMWYSTYGPKPRVTGYATSRDGIHWVKFEGNPVLPLGTPGQWDDYSAFQPFVFHQDGYFHMIYNGSGKRSATGYRWGYAWSKDGIHWTKSPDNPIFLPGQDGAWDGGKVSCPTLLRTGLDTFHIYYCGARTPSATYLGIGLALGRLHKLATEGMPN